MPTPSPLGVRLRQLRVETGLTQEELARQANVRQQTVLRIEIGLTTDPHWETVLKLAEVLDANLSWLAYGDLRADTAA